MHSVRPLEQRRRLKRWKKVQGWRRGAKTTRRSKQPAGNLRLPADRRGRQEQIFRRGQADGGCEVQ